MSNSDLKIMVPGVKLTNIRLRPAPQEKHMFFLPVKRGEYLVTHLGILKRLGSYYDLIPYKNIYIPKQGDYVVGVVVGYAPNGWIIDIGSFTKAFLPGIEGLKKYSKNGDVRFDPKQVELSKILKIGDLVGAVIQDINMSNHPILAISPDMKTSISSRYLGKLEGYYAIKVHTTKIPRIIGKKGSMIRILKQGLNGDVVVGQNGVVLFKGDYDAYLKLVYVLNLIIKNTFAQGLTNRIAELLGVKIEGGEDKGVSEDNE